ncbi:MAG: hypothetical protein D6708_15625, partial [Candidatus Dadabacteria bacterium]
MGGALALVLAACAGPQPRTSPEPAVSEAPASRVRITGVEITPADAGDRIHLEADGTPEHALTVSDAPPAATLTLSNVTLEGVAPRVDVGDGVVERIEARALPGGGAVFTVTAAGPVEARAQPVERGLDLLVTLGGSPAEPAAAAKGQAEPAQPAPAVEALPGGEGVRFRFGAEPSNLAAFLLS